MGMSISFAIMVNGERHDVAIPNMLTHTDIAKMAYGDDIVDQPHAKYLSCTYKTAHNSGILFHGGPGIKPRPDMRFTITSTSNA